MLLRTAAWHSPRLVTALCLLTLVLVGCSPEHYPQTTLLPRGDFARIADDLLDTTVKWALLVFVLVEGVLIYAIFRFRGKPGDPEPHQTHGNTTVEIIWTVIPALILAVIAVPTVKAIFQTNATPAEDALTDRSGGPSVVVGVPLSRIQPDHGQRAARAGGPDSLAPHGQRRRHPQLLGAPVRGQARRLCQSGDPAVVQGRGRTASIRAVRRVLRHPARAHGVTGSGTEAGGVSGLGGAHADARPQAAGPSPPRAQADCAVPGGDGSGATVQSRRPRTAGSEYATGEKLFQAKGCVGCHSLEAVNAPKGMVGPNLANVGARSYIAAGTLKNTDENLARWIRDPQDIKKGVLMPNLGVTEPRPRPWSRFSGRTE